mgnify:CR=1 FL=1
MLFNCSVRILGIVGTAILATGAAAQTSSSTPASSGPVFSKNVGAVVSGLGGLVTGAKDALNKDRAFARMVAIRSVVTTTLLERKKEDSKINLGKVLEDAQQNKKYQLSDEIILCDPRGSHSVAAADASYLDAFTTTFNQIGTPTKITTIGEAVGSFFQNYSAEVPKGEKRKATSVQVVSRCKDDLKVWPTQAYGRSLASLPQSTGFIPDVADAAAAISTLYNALVAILTPIITAPAQAIDRKRRADEIVAILKANEKDLLSAATGLAHFSSVYARNLRLQALGQFEEKLAALRTASVDLSKSTTCEHIAGTTPVLRTEATKGTDDKPVTTPIPTDDFVMCYLDAWKQINDQVTAVVSAAADYDTFADASDDKLQDAVSQIQKGIGDAGNIDQATNISQLFEAAGQLIAYGQTVSQALSPDNRTKVEQSIADLNRVFGGRPAPAQK